MDAMARDADIRAKETYEQIMAMSRETYEQIKGMSRDTDRKMQETDRKMQETDRKMQETDRQIKELSANIGGVNNRLGDIAEGLLTSDLLKMFAKYGLEFDTVIRNAEICEKGTKKPLAEVDWLMLDTTVALVGEAKAHLTQGDIDKHLNRMKILASKENRLLEGKKLYAAVAGVKITETAKNYAKRRGLFVLDPSGNTVKIEAPDGEPAVW
jgi:hypothetical protein